MARVDIEGSGKAIGLGSWMGILIGSLDSLSSIIKREQAECLINALRRWRKEGVQLR